MLTVSQRLIALNILYEIYLHENVKTTPFYQLMLDLLVASSKHPAETRLLNELVKSVPKISKLTPNQLIKSTEAEVPKTKFFETDMEPYKKAHTENMPIVPLIHSSSVPPVISDHNDIPQAKIQEIHNQSPVCVQLENEELELHEFLPNIERIQPSKDSSNEDYLLTDVF